MTTEENSIPELSGIKIEALLKQPEDEVFDRTRGGQDNIGRKIAGFGTKNGGILLVGQEDIDKGGEIVGINEDEFQENFNNAIAGVNPPPLTQQRVVKTGEKLVAIIRIQDVGTLKPCSYGGMYYERKGRSTRRLTPDEVRRYHLLYGSANAEDIPTPAKKADVDDSELEVYSLLLKKTKENILASVMENNFLTVRGVTVLAKKPDDYLEGAFIEIQRYDSFIGSAPNPIGSALKLSKPARQMIEEAAIVVEQNIPVTRTYDGAKMIQKPSIPASIIRETITNAIAHRNYRSHEHVRIRIYSDGFDVSNPAVITEKMWNEIMASQTTYHPNEGIYTFLNPAQLFEGRGEGVWKIREELQKLGKVAPEFKVIGEGPSSFYVRISITPARAKDLKRKRLTDLITTKKEITTSDVMEKLQVSRVTAINFLKELVDQGILEHQGSTRSSKYIVKATPTTDTATIKQP